MMIGGSSCRISILNLPHSYIGRSGRVISGTLLDTGGTVRKYATMAFRSAGVMAEKADQSMGNGGRRTPFGRVPVVITRLIWSSVHPPRPVSLSDVRLPVGQSPNGRTR